jgi:hypothetical protein
MTITDLTDRFHKTEFMRNGPGAWSINRVQVPFRNIIIHHTGSHMVNGIPYAYGVRTDGQAVTPWQEEQAILALARDHFGRFGIWPGYMGALFQSGRGYWIGKAGTKRRHTSNTQGRTDGRTWNYDSVAIVLWGNMNYAALPPAMLETGWEMASEAMTWGITKHPVEVFGHRDVFNTGCPGSGAQTLIDYIKMKARPTPPPFDRVKALGLVDAISRDTAAAKTAIDRIEVNSAEIRRMLEVK